MPLVTETTYSDASKVAANTALLGVIDAGASGGQIKIYDALDILLAAMVLADPAGTVNGTTGQLTLTVASQEGSAEASGTAAYCEILDSNNALVVSMPVAEGVVAVPGFLVINSLSIVQDSVVNINSAIIG